jgi:hypothetical protein
MSKLICAEYSRVSQVTPPFNSLGFFCSYRVNFALKAEASPPHGWLLLTDLMWWTMLDRK